MLSLSCKAAIKAVVYLGSTAASGKRLGLVEIAGFIGENEHTVGKLLQKLVKEGLVNSIKGPGGGFYLTDEQMQQRLLQIVEAIDGADVFDQCGLGLSRCSEKRPCPIHNDFKPIRELFYRMCSENRIADMHEGVGKGVVYLF